MTFFLATIFNFNEVLTQKFKTSNSFWPKKIKNFKKNFKKKKKTRRSSKNSEIVYRVIYDRRAFSFLLWTILYCLSRKRRRSRSCCRCRRWGSHTQARARARGQKVSCPTPNEINAVLISFFAIEVRAGEGSNSSGAWVPRIEAVKQSIKRLKRAI